MPKFISTSSKTCATFVSDETDDSLAKAFQYEFLTQYDLELSTNSISSLKLKSSISHYDDSMVDESEQSVEDTIWDDLAAYTGGGVKWYKPIIITTAATFHSTKWMPIMNTLLGSSKDEN